jgi:peptidoglycan/LPS O-acetylase OafA/YrhL
MTKFIKISLLCLLFALIIIIYAVANKAPAEGVLWNATWISIGLAFLSLVTDAFSSKSKKH